MNWDQKQSLDITYPIQSAHWRLVFAIQPRTNGRWSLTVSSHWHRVGKKIDSWPLLDHFSVWMSTEEATRFMRSTVEEACGQFAKEISNLKCDPC